MDIVERLKQEFSGNALKDIADQTRAYVKERHVAADEIERLRSQMDLFDPSTTQQMAAAALNFANDAIGQLQERNHALRERVELLEGHLNGALNLVENFAHCDTTDARKALGGE